MTTPTILTACYGPINQFVKGTTGHIRTNAFGHAAVAFLGEEVGIFQTPDIDLARDWVREVAARGSFDEAGADEGDYEPDAESIALARAWA